jgi:hypothetical protein
MGIPSHQSITGDFKAINKHNDKIKKYNNIFEMMEQFINETWTANNKTDEHIFKIFNKLEDEPYRRFLDQQPIHKGYEKLKVSQIFIRLRDVCLARTLDIESFNKKIVDTINQDFIEAFEALKAEKDIKDILDVFDVPYRVRRFFRMKEILKLIYEVKELTDEDREKIDELISELSKCLVDVDDIEWNTWNIDAGESKGWFAKRLGEIRENIKKSNLSSLKQDFKALMDSMFLPTEQGFEGLPKEFARLSERGKELAIRIDEVIKNLKLINNPLSDYPPFIQIYKLYDLRDMYIYPMELMSDLGEKDNIEVTRISPKDAKFISCDPNSKLAGETLGHFGGFLKKEWRKNDIMWGRLDAAELIIRTLYTKNKEEFEDIREFTKEVLHEIMEEELKGQIKGDNITYDQYVRYLRDEYTVGKESMNNIEPNVAFPLILNVLKSLKDMFKYDKRKREGGGKLPDKLFGFIDAWGGKILNYVSLPLSLAVNALFEKAPLIRKTSRFIILTLGLWGSITLIIFIVGRVMSIDWLNISWPLVGIAAAAVVVATVLAGILVIKKPKPSA